ncbi:hypothetical protein BJ138DRAFT_1177450 [Hygrophoropsis aurantiaca]|uniref:Uncharacterized protein n=1 Tax=Hygrophoropsis aurantiaca TaxID=72124 RepID=A0ACB8ALZ3_9AGAM|nr:hypothetical protein BJ138DRAFT_1177450 [Hygrophoropsis aurantiaca]
MAVTSAEDLPSKLAPRAYLDGIDLPPNFQLPRLDKVREDAAKIAQLTRDGPGAGALGIFKTDKGPSEPTLLNEPLAYNMRLPHLFKWAYFAQNDDTPDDLHEGCIFALGMFIRVLQECNEEALRRVGHILPGQELVVAKYYMVMNAGYKLTRYLTSPEIDRPAEALPYFKMLAEEDIRQNAKEGSIPWIQNPILYAKYADALVLSGSTDNKTKLMIEHAIEGLMKSDLKTTADIIRMKLHLARVRHCQGIKSKEAKENEDSVTKFLRKNPNLIQRAHLKQALIRPGQPEHHILTALGGPAWFDNTKETFKSQERAEKLCRTCGGREPQKTLVRCGGCQYIWYCSKECQVANWKFHKVSCSEMSNGCKKLEALQSSGSNNAQRTADWMKWRLGSLGANSLAPIHALGLRRDPSRGRTHILFCQVEYTPNASRDMTHKFQIASAGVYRAKDVMPEIEAALHINSGEGKEYIDGLLADLDSAELGSEIVPVIYLLLGDGLETWLGSTGVPQDVLRRIPYDPKWRKTMNKDAPPAEMRFIRQGIQDAEHIF